MSSDDFRLVRKEVQPAGHDSASMRSRLSQQRLPDRLQDFEKAAPHYRLDHGIETAINMALAVAAPLLLTGEPGTGKTQVAYFLGWYFGIPVFDFQVRSTSTAASLKYDFDAVAYLREAQHPDPKQRRNRQDFLEKRALWKAYECECESVLLIDEIDKAPRDFPNDLLQELDKHQFAHPFTEEFIRPSSGRPPIVVITSNSERRLPDAFLRRCIYHHIELTEALISEVLSAQREGIFPHLAESAIEAACKRFWELRQRDLRKPPSTAELLAWLAILSAQRIQAHQIQKAAWPALPGLAALIKDRDDLEALS